MDPKQLTNGICPWCQKTFVIGSELVGMDMESEQGEIIVWFHPTCIEKYNETTYDLMWNGKSLVVNKPLPEVF